MKMPVERVNKVRSVAWGADLPAEEVEVIWAIRLKILRHVH